MERVFGICRKRDDSIWVFKGTPVDYKPWKDRIIDHIAILNDRWRVVLNYVEKCPKVFSFQEMGTQTMDNYHLHELAKILFNWISAWLPKRLYNKRLQLAGNEFGNGLELWRRLRLRFEGTGEICEVAGVDGLHTFPKCKLTKDVEEHLDDWEEMVDLYGGPLSQHAPGHLRVMLIKTLPSETENEILDHPELKTMEQIIDYLRGKLLYRNQKHLASYIRPGSSRVSALRGLRDDTDDDEDDAPPSRGKTEKRGGTLDQIAKMIEKQTELMSAFRPTSGRQSPRRPPSPNRGKRFMWTGGCHECGGDHMKKDCGKWKKVLEQNGGKLPAGHINAYTKARDVFNKANGIEPLKPRPKPKARAERTHAKALRAEEEESEFSSNDSEAEYEVPMRALRTRCCALSVATSVKNKYGVLDDGMGHEDIEEHVAALNSWAHKVTYKPTRPKGKKPRVKAHKMDVTIENEADLDIALAENEILRQRLPGVDADTMMVYAAMIKKAPSPETLQEGECWAMVDSGSGVDGMDIDAVCPGVKVEKASHAITCITASGEEMVADQVARLHVSLDGQDCDIPFSKLPLSMPIISVRRHIHRGHRCRIQEGGGYFRNVKTRKKSRFIEKDGVYFMRLKVIGSADEFPSLSFTRPGTP